MKRTYYVEPVPKPRMTRADRWKKRACVLRYRAFCDKVRLARLTLPLPCRVVFWMPMPLSWPEAKRARMEGRLHEQKPDLDNLLKALLDAVFASDAHVSSIWAEKRWADDAAIEVEPLQTAEVKLQEAA